MDAGVVDAKVRGRLTRVEQPEEQSCDFLKSKQATIAVKEMTKQVSFNELHYDYWMIILHG